MSRPATSYLSESGQRPVYGSPSRSLPVISMVNEASVEQDYIVWMMDAYGRVVRKIRTSGADTTVDIAVSDLAAGLYLIKVTDREGNLESSGKVILNK